MNLCPCEPMGYVGLDHIYGEIYWIRNNPPRKWLLEHFNRQHIRKMYRDDPKTGVSHHVGYVVAGRWIQVFRFCRWEKY